MTKADESTSPTSAPADTSTSLDRATNCWWVVMPHGHFASREEALARAARDGLFVVRCDKLVGVADAMLASMEAVNDE